MFHRALFYNNKKSAEKSHSSNSDTSEYLVVILDRKLAFRNYVKFVVDQHLCSFFSSLSKFA